MIADVRKDFLNGKYNDVLSLIYCGDEATQTQRYVSVLEKFKELYGDGNVNVFSASGRTEIGGNHTDHQNGRVLTASVNLDAIAVVSKREDSVIRITSEGYGEITVDISTLEVVESEKGTTAALVRGTAAAMEKRGYKVGGFDGYITSDVLSGSGLSSSAAYEVLLANVLSGLYNDGKIDAITIACIGQEAENVHFGKPCGLLDQMASSVGGLIYIDFKDSKKPKVKKLDALFNDFGHALCIVDTKGSHADLTDEYAAIPMEMKKVAEFFGKNILSEVEESEFFEKISEIRNYAGDRAVLRAIHWYAENERVDVQADALKKGDFERFKGAVKASGDSSFKYLQNVYASKSTNEQNVSVALALSESILKGRGVSRVHGGGFAGTIQAFVPNELAGEYKEKMERVFGNGACYVLSIRPIGGIKVV